MMYEIVSPLLKTISEKLADPTTIGGAFAAVLTATVWSRFHHIFWMSATET
jgi:hypothetical protein